MSEIGGNTPKRGNSPLLVCSTFVTLIRMQMFRPRTSDFAAGRCYRGIILLHAVVVDRMYVQGIENRSMMSGQKKHLKDSGCREVVPSSTKYVSTRRVPAMTSDLLTPGTLGT